MRSVAVGAFAAAGLVAAVCCLSRLSEAAAQSPQVGRGEWQASGGELLAFTSEVGGRQQITVIDPRQRVLAAYQVDPASGAIALKGVRQIHWDLQMDEFNTAHPSPREIRALLDER